MVKRRASIWRVATVLTMVVGVSMAVRAISGEKPSLWLILWMVVIWMGVAIVEVGRRINRR